MMDYKKRIDLMAEAIAHSIGRLHRREIEEEVFLADIDRVSRAYRRILNAEGAFDKLCLNMRGLWSTMAEDGCVMVDDDD